MADETLAAPDTGSEKTKRARPTKPLPTDRIAFTKQLDILRAYAVAHESTGKAVTNADVAAIVKMAASTVPHANSFFADAEIGLLLKAEGGYVPSATTIAFNRAYAWNPETAAHKLAPSFQQTWFGQALLPRLGFRAMSEREAIGVLAEASAARPEYEGQLELALQFLESTGLIQRDGDQISASRTTGLQPQTTVQLVGVEAKATPASPTRGVETTFARSTDSDGVHFNVSIHVDMKEMGGWTPDRITAFFTGFAKVLAAKGALEKSAAQSVTGDEE